MPSLVTTVNNFTAQEDDKKKQNEVGLLEITCPTTAAGLLYFPMLYISFLGTSYCQDSVSFTFYFLIIGRAIGLS